MYVRRLLQRAAAFAHRVAGLGAGVPPEPQVWAELAPELALRRISTTATEGRFAR
ncbi:hypothetical protein KZZ52_28400 [Dactylosporangium sp. AC04546]|uniref:hypothetical protein n=1 Tax=Dactylosporangium sp. AC04546 TaxID=2862460 RepID=UPI001EDE95A6|nr:hypothetical protein [Dactylosporangium sp. AC04546]WVK89191.1 hypothetical protein KZZ52_28400 [Dactylosporangium sp. AC04546]